MLAFVFLEKFLARHSSARTRSIRNTHMQGKGNLKCRLLACLSVRLCMVVHGEYFYDPSIPSCHKPLHNTFSSMDPYKDAIEFLEARISEPSSVVTPPGKGPILKRALKRGINHSKSTVPRIATSPEILKITQDGVARDRKEECDDSYDQPLDMTVKRFKRGESIKRRPSVIAFASNGLPKKSNPTKRRPECNGSPSPSSPSEPGVTGTSQTQNASPRKGSRRVIIGEGNSTGETEMIIDEHFRRSLGTERFKDLFKKTENTPCDEPSETADGTEKEKTESASVDDHFAKALGSDYWLTLNKTIPKSSKASEKSRDGTDITNESQEENVLH